MGLTAEQVKGRMKNLAKENDADARVLIRMFMMERFLERMSLSKYAEHFVIKGGMLVSSMVGISMRSTMDIDATIQNIPLTEQDAYKIVEEIGSIDLGDGVLFKTNRIETIMDEMEYPGIRVSIDAYFEEICTPIKFDISTGDAITPRAIEYNYKLMLDERSIKLWSYNLETMLAEKLQTILARGVLNTRMRDFYDIYALLLTYANIIDKSIFQNAFAATCTKRGTLKLRGESAKICDSISNDPSLRALWDAYRGKYSYAGNIEYSSVIESVKMLITKYL